MKLIFAVTFSLILSAWASIALGNSRTKKRSIQQRVLRVLNHRGVQKKSTPSRIWYYAHWSFEQGQHNWSNRLFTILLNKKSTLYDKNEIYLSIARNYFHKRQFKSALIYYNKIPKSSDLWLLSVEERAWSKVRLGNYNGALADAATLRSSVFSHISSPETFYLNGYINLAICNYKAVFKNTDTFKKQQGPKIAALESLKNHTGDSWVVPFVDSVSKKGVEASLTRKVLARMPRFFYKYKKLRRILDRIESSKKYTSRDVKKIKSSLATYARYDLKEYRVVIKKLQLIEADVIQRIHVDETLLGQRKWMPKKDSSDKYSLNFPFDEEDVWIDELDNYDVKAKTCPKLMEARL